MDQGRDPVKIGVIGLGYVGLVTAAVLADHGNNLVGVDIDSEKIKSLTSRVSPIYEVDKSSRTVTSIPTEMHFLTRWYPRKPLPPVINIFFMS